MSDKIIRLEMVTFQLSLVTLFEIRTPVLLDN